MLTKHFSAEELQCRCGCGACDMDADFLDRLERLRYWFDEPMQITSGFRCPAYNQRVHGAKDSQHMKGLAVDIRVTDARKRFELVVLAYEAGFKGVGVHKDFVHIDTRKAERVLFLY